VHYLPVGLLDVHLAHLQERIAVLTEQLQGESCPEGFYKELDELLPKYGSFGE
jgi:hypothetical protein